MAWFVYELTGSTLATGASLISSFLPRALFSPLAGVAADKLSRKTLIVVSDIVSGVVVLCMYALAAWGQLTLPAILGFTALLSISSAFIGPAASAAIQSVLTESEYQTANSLRQLRWRFSTVVGAFLGGLLLKVVGIRYLLLLNALSFLASALAESFIDLPRHRHGEEEENRDKDHAGLWTAVRFLLANKALLFLLLFVMVIANGLFMCLFVYMPAIFRDVLGASSAEMGLYYALEAGAATLTALVLLRRQLKKPFAWVMGMLLVEGAVLMAHGLIQSYWAAYGLALLLGVSTTICVVMVMTVEQLLVPNSMMGRFSSIAAFLGDGAMPIFTLLYGFLGLRLPVQDIVLYSGAFFLIALLPAPWAFSQSSLPATSSATP
jgi:MFS family permease